MTTTILLAPIIFTNEYYWGGGQDLLLHFHPVREAGYNYLKSGEFPLWYPDCASGLPYQTGFRTLLYPVHLLGLIFSTGVAIKLSLVGHAFLAAFLMMSFVNWLGINKYGAIFSGFSFAGSGFMMAKFFCGHLDSIEVLAYAPLVVWSFLITFRYRGIGWCLLCAGSVAIMGFAGNYEKIYYSVTGACSLLIFLSLAGSRVRCGALNWKEPWSRDIECRDPNGTDANLLTTQVPWSEKWRDLGHALQRIALVGAVSIGAILFRFLPSAQSALFSNRIGAPEAFGGSEPPMLSFLTYLVPHFYEGTSSILCWSAWPSWEQQGYVGIVLLSVSLLAFHGDSREWLPPAFLAGFFFLVSLGNDGLIYSIWREFDPLLQNFRTPGRFSFLVMFFLTWLAALGTELVWKQRISLKKAVLSASPIALLVVGLFLWLFSLRSDPTSWGQFVQRHTTPEAWAYLLQDHPDNLTGLLKTNLFRSGVSLTLALLALLALLLPNRRAVAALTLLALIDLTLAAKPYLKTAPPSAYALPPVVQNAVKELKPGERVLWHSSFQWYNRFAPLGVHDIAAYDQFLDKTYAGAVNIQNGVPEQTALTLTNQVDGGPFWDLQGARLIITPYPLERSSLTLQAQSDGVYIYQNLNAFPRAFVVDNSPPISLREVMRQALTNLPSLSGSPVESLKITANQAVMTVRLEKPGTLILTDAPWPGWRVYVNGVERPLLKVHGELHRGVELQPGNHTVTFRYWPNTFTYGLIGSLATLLLALGLARPWTYRPESP